MDFWNLIKPDWDHLYHFIYYVITVLTRNISKILFNIKNIFQTNVLYTYRKGPDAIHFCDSEIEVGKCVELEIDWSRRFDHMQQHTGQHLISAIFDVSSVKSWNAIKSAELVFHAIKSSYESCIGCTFCCEDF